MNFLKYVWAMRWHNPGLSIIIQNSNIAAAKPEIVKFKKNQDTRHCISAHRRDIIEIPTALPRFWVQLSNGIDRNTVQLNWKWKNPRCLPKNFDCVYLCLQTRYQQNFIGFTYFFGVQHSI